MVEKYTKKEQDIVVKNNTFYKFAQEYDKTFPGHNKSASHLAILWASKSQFKKKIEKAAKLKATLEAELREVLPKPVDQLPVRRFECLRCGHIWKPIVKTPHWCPRCNARDGKLQPVYEKAVVADIKAGENTVLKTAPKETRNLEELITLQYNLLLEQNELLKEIAGTLTHMLELFKKLDTKKEG